MAKKKFSPKQIAAQKKFAKIMKSGGFKKRVNKVKRKITQKVNKQRKRSTRSVAKGKSRKGGKRSPGKKSFIDRIPILNNKTVQKVGFGLGMGVVVTNLISLIAQFAPPALAQPLVQNQRIIKLGVEAATEPISAVVDLALSSGMIQKVAGGMGNGNGGTMNQNMVGFA